ncbi:MAG: PEP-CTERM sorting domain-containing protein [Acidobacteria bacterium]|nr:PEP-CTERM sorting domain-containing protein [Acidobacteriota bacterium]
MKSLLTVAVVLLFCAALGATPVTITDPYAGSNPSGSSNGDVIGALSRFDIDMITFTSATNLEVQMEILFNYNDGDANLNAFNIGGGSPDLNVGDILFSVGGNLTYGIALKDHNALIAGHLYQLTGGKTAFDVLNWGSTSSTNYRPNEFVWIDPVGATDIGTGAVLSSVFDHTEILAKISFTPTSGFLTDLGSGVGMQFASATCGNDMIKGDVQMGAVPEPATFGLMGAALLGLGLLRLRKRA